MTDFTRSREIFLKIYPDRNLSEKIEKHIKKHRARFNLFYMLCSKKHWELALKQHPMMKLALVYAYLPTVYDKYREKKISDKIFYDTMSDIKIWIDDHKERTGEDGLDELNWIMHHMLMGIFRLGRLQFQKFFWYSKFVYEKNGVKIDFGDKIINMHIPRGEKLDYDACVESVEMSQEFFKEYFPDFPRDKYMCNSWLLYSRNKEFMPQNSNILKFGTLFDVAYEKEEAHSTYLWLFGVKLKNADLMKNKKNTGSYGFTDMLPQKNALQKSTVEYIKNGGTFGVGLGVILKK